MKVKDGMVLNDYGVAILIITDLITEQEEKDIMIGIDSVPVIREFISDINSGSFKPKTTVNKFEKIIERYD